MSIRVMTSVWDDARTQTHSELLVLLALADWGNDDGYCWPTIPALAAKARLSERAVQQILGRLTETGRIKRVSGGGRGHANKYQVLLQKNPESETVNPIHRKEYTESSAPNGINPLAPKRVNLTTEKGEPGAPHTSYTRQKNNTTTSSLLSDGRTCDAEANGSSSSSSSPPLVDELRRVYGLSNSQRDEVVIFIGSHGEDYVREKWEIVRSQPRRNGAGALLAALRDNWQTPVGYPQTNGPPDKEGRLAVAEARGRERGWTW
jgi:hypothetical protein